jgi:hypothetical protein
MPRQKKSAKPKRHCVKNQKTRRCIRSVDANETSAMCKFSNRTQRCKTVQNKEYVVYNSYKVIRTVPGYLNKNIVHQPLDKLRSKAEKHPDFEDTAEVLFTVRSGRTEADTKHAILNELLELAENAAREREDSDVITMKSIRYAIKEDNAFAFLRK